MGYNGTINPIKPCLSPILEAYLGLNLANQAIRFDFVSLKNEIRNSKL